MWNAYVHVLLVITQPNDCQGYKKPHIGPVWHTLCSDLWDRRGEVVWGAIWRLVGASWWFPADPAASPYSNPAPGRVYHHPYLPRGRATLSCCHLIITIGFTERCLGKKKTSLWICELPSSLRKSRSDFSGVRLLALSSVGCGPQASSFSLDLSEPICEMRVRGWSGSILPGRWVSHCECIAGCYVLGIQRWIRQVPASRSQLSCGRSTKEQY